MSQAPAELWLCKTIDGPYWYDTNLHEEPAVRYVRADLYEALMANLYAAVVERAPQEPLP